MVEFFARDTDYIEKLNELAAGGPGGGAALTATYVGVGDGSNLLSGSNEVTYSSGNFVLGRDQNSALLMKVINPNTGTSAGAYFTVANGVYETKLTRSGPSYSGVGLVTAEQSILENTGLTGSTLFLNWGPVDFIYSCNGRLLTDERFRIYNSKGIGIRSSGADFNLKIASTEGLTADRQLTIHLGDADRILNLATQTLTDAATVAWDAALGPVAKVTLAGNRTLGAPTNLVDGGTYILRVIQDGTGTRTLAYNAVFKWPGGTAPVLTTTAGAVDILTFVSDGANLYGVAQKGFA